MSFTNRVFAGYKARQALLEASTSPFARGIAWIEGELFPLRKARILLLDQGFLHSDLTYDVPSVWDGRFSVWTTTLAAWTPVVRSYDSPFPY